MRKLSALSVVAVLVVLIALAIDPRTDSGSRTAAPTSVKDSADFDSAVIAPEAVDAETPRDFDAGDRARGVISTRSNAARLVVRTLDPERRVLPGTLVFVAANEFLATGLRTTSEGLQRFGVRAGVEIEIEAPLRAALDGVTQLRAPKRRVPPLQIGEERVLELVLEVAALVTDVTLRVVDERHEPVRRQRVGLARGGPIPLSDKPRTLLGAAELPRLDLEGVTDAQGECVFANVGSGEWWAIIASARAPGDPVDREAVASIAERFSVPEFERMLAIELEAPRGVFLRGRVEVAGAAPGASGARAPSLRDVTLTATRADGAHVACTPDDDGTFAIGPLTRQEFVLTSAGPFAPLEPLRAKPDGAPLVIHLTLGARLTGRAFDAESGAGVECEYAITKLYSKLPVQFGTTNAAGKYAVDGLADGQYVVAVWTQDGRTGVSQRDFVTAGALTVALDAPLTHAAPRGYVRVTVKQARESARVELWRGEVCRAGFAVPATLEQSVVVPPGSIEVRWISGGECVNRRSVTVEAGEEQSVSFGR